MALWKNKTSYQYCPTAALYSPHRYRITVHAHRVWWWVPWIVNLTQPEMTWEKGISRRGCLDMVNLQACLRWSLLIVLIEVRTPTQNVGNAFSNTRTWNKEGSCPLALTLVAEFFQWLLPILIPSVRFFRLPTWLEYQQLSWNSSGFQYYTGTPEAPNFIDWALTLFLVSLEWDSHCGFTHTPTTPTTQCKPIW